MLLNQDKKKYDFGILICTYDRYEFLLITLNSYILCHNIKNIKFCIVDDCSQDDYVDMAIEQFKNALPESCGLKVIKHDKNYGKNKYGDTIREGVKALSDCPYVLFSPDDVVVNPWLFDVVRESIKLIGDKIKIISHMSDTRARKTNGLYRVLSGYNKFYDYVAHTDGFLSLIPADILSGLSYKNLPAESGSGLWPVLNRQFNAKNYEQLRLKESMCFHFGNLKSKMNSVERAIHPLRSIRFNISRRPEVLK